MDDLYARLRELETALMSHGRAEVAERLAEAVTAGTTGTEILFRVRWVLRQESVGESVTTPDLAVRIAGVLAEIDSLLPG